jgi:hypothetical protein
LQLYEKKYVYLQPETNKTKIKGTMAYYIKPIPTLTGDVAQRFNERAAEAEANRGSIDFTEQVEVARSILAEAHL